MFRVLVAGGPCEKYIHKCITSILEQNEKDVEVLVSLDPYDHAYSVANAIDSKRVKVSINNACYGPCFNRWKASTLSEMNDDDIIATVDGDDWLLSDDALTTVGNAYDNDKEILVTHGSWISFPNKLSGKDCLRPYTEEDFKSIRKAPWKATQLRTMKYSVYKRIKKEDLQDDNGNWFLGATDMALMFPAVEMAGYGRVQFIDKPIYAYNLNCQRISQTNQDDRICAEKILRARKPYARI